jgi:RHS repeat-associated protein
MYDDFGNLLAVKFPNGNVIEYIIDSEGRRVGKLVNGTLVAGYLYQGSQIVAQLNSAGKVISRFIYATRANSPDYMVISGIPYRIFADQLGSPRLVVNATTGAIAEEIDYDEFGNVINDTKPGFQPFGFAGGLYDSDTKLVHFGAREYDPRIGRWTTKDPILFAGGDTNLYGYVREDPVNLTDLRGLQDASPETSVLNDPAPSWYKRLVRSGQRLRTWIKQKVCKKCEQQREQELENNGTTAKDLTETQATHLAVEGTAEIAGENAEMEAAGKATGPVLTIVEASELLAKGLITIKQYNDKIEEAVKKIDACQ